MPNHDILPICDREITIMRPDPETECINVHPDVSIKCYFLYEKFNKAYFTKILSKKEKLKVENVAYI